MRDWMILLEDSATDHTVRLSEIVQHFKDRYGQDITDVNTSQGHYDVWCRANRLLKRRADKDVFNRYMDDPTGQAACPPYFNFRHFCLSLGQNIPWQFNERTDQRWKIVPLPTAAEAMKKAEEQMDVFARVLSNAKSMGIESNRVMLPSVGGEAADILTRIETDFGHRISVLID